MYVYGRTVTKVNFSIVCVTSKVHKLFCVLKIRSTFLNVFYIFTQLLSFIKIKLKKLTFNGRILLEDVMI